MKLVQKNRIGSKIKKKYSKPITPYQRLLDSKYIPEETKNKLIKIYNEIKLIELFKQMQKLIDLLVKSTKQCYNNTIYERNNNKDYA